MQGHSQRDTGQPEEAVEHAPDLGSPRVDDLGAPDSAWTQLVDDGPDGERGREIVGEWDVFPW